MLRHIPNAITSLNLVMGCLSIIAALDGDLTLASLFIAASAILDFFDGLAARLLRVHSEYGKQLDSLADVVSFGVAPGMILYVMGLRSLGDHTFFLGDYVAFIVPVFSAIRLAKFNIDTRQTDSFIGLPVPANSIFIASIPFIIESGSFGLDRFFQHPYFLLFFPLLSAFMLVSPLPLLALKFKSMGWKENSYRYLLIILSLLSILIFKYAGIALCILLYILISIVYNFQSRQKQA